MSKHEKTWQQIVSGRSDYNIKFNDLVALLDIEASRSDIVAAVT